MDEHPAGGGTVKIAGNGETPSAVCTGPAIIPPDPEIGPPAPPAPPDLPAKDAAALQLANAIRDLIREELKNQDGSPKKPPAHSPWNTFWSVVLFVDFLLIATVVLETAIEGANLKLFLDVFPLLSALLVFLLPQIRDRLDTLSQRISFRIGSLIMLGPLTGAALPWMSVPAVVLPVGTPVTSNGRLLSTDDGTVVLRLRPSYDVKLTSSDASQDPRDYHLTLANALKHWWTGTPVEWALWYEVKLESVTPDVSVRVERQSGEFPKEFLDQLRTNHYSRVENSKSRLDTSFADDGTKGNVRKVRLLPYGKYTFTASLAGCEAATREETITPSNLAVGFPELRKKEASR